MNTSAELPDHICHSLQHLINAADRMIQAIAVLQVRQNRKRPGTFPGRHSQVFGLKGKRVTQPFIVKIFRQPVIYRISSMQLGQRVQHIPF
ncbi:hypothetical protein D3C75_509100 [compost metagenome]